MAEGETPTRLRLREQIVSAAGRGYGTPDKRRIAEIAAMETFDRLEAMGALSEASDTVAAAPQPKTCATCRHMMLGSRFLWCQREPSPTMGERVEPDYFCALFESKGHAHERTEP